MCARVIAIDFGTTSSRVAVNKNGKVEVITNDHMNRQTPSYIGFTKEEVLVGEEAKDSGPHEPESTIHGFKYLLGSSSSGSLQQHSDEYRLFSVKPNKNNSPILQVRPDLPDQLYTPEKLTAVILSSLKKTAETYLQKRVTDAVIIVPSFFNVAQRRAIINASNAAGLLNIELINEPTAAAINYAHRKQNLSETVLVFSLGGGILDISILTIKGMDLQVKCISKNNRIEGEDFTRNLMTYFIRSFQRKHNKNLKSNKNAIWRLREECDSLKTKLSSSPKIRFFVHSIMDGIDINETVSRDTFNTVNVQTFPVIESVIKDVLKSANMNASQIDKVILAGGSSRIPKIQDLLKKYFKKRIISALPNPDEAAIYGATIYQHLLSYKKITVTDILPRNLYYSFNDSEPTYPICFTNTSAGNIMRVDVTPDMRFISIYEGEGGNRTWLGDCSLQKPDSLNDDLLYKIEFYIDNSRILNVSELYQRKMIIDKNKKNTIKIRQ